MDQVKKNIPNALSILRIIMVVPFIYALGYEDKLGMILILTTILASDYIDGYLARKWNVTSDLGRILDPLADKFVIVSVAVVLVIFRDFPLWLALAMIARDIGILLAGFYMIRRDLPIPVSNNLGRITVGVFAAAMIIFLFSLNILKTPIVIISAFMLFLSWFSYGKAFLKAISSSSEGRGIVE